MAIVISSMVLFKKEKYKDASKNSAKKDAKVEKEATVVQRSIPQKLTWIAGDGQFWRVSIASACLLVSKGFEAIAPLYISSVLKLSPSSSAMLVAAIPAGLVVSVLWGASYIDRMEQTRKSAWMVSLCCLNICTCSIICGLTWYLESGGECNTVIAIIICMVMFFSLGFSAGYCFYVPQSIYAIEFGGADSATVIGCSELIQVSALTLELFVLFMNPDRLSTCLGCCRRRQFEDGWEHLLDIWLEVCVGIDHRLCSDGGLEHVRIPAKGCSEFIKTKGELSTRPFYD